jgi:hypothetical protein
MQSDVVFDTIPDELKQLRAWVLWRAEIDGKRVPLDTDKARKVPYQPSGKRASSTDPAQWSTFQRVADTYDRGGAYDGIGCVIQPPYVGIDLDDCIDSESGLINQWAVDILNSMPSYAEISPSGKGIKLWVKGSIPDSVKTESIEIYSHSRYFTVTGNPVDLMPTEISTVNGELTDLWQSLQKPVQAAEKPAQPRSDAIPSDDWIGVIIERGRRIVADAADGNKHNARIRAARLLGGLCTHGLSEDEIINILYDANPPSANLRGELKAIRDGIEYGKARPHSAPVAPQPPMMRDGWAVCPHHQQKPLERSKNGNGFKCHVSTGKDTWCDYWWQGEGYVMPDEKPKEKHEKETKFAERSESVEYVTDWKSGIVSAAQLQTMLFPELRWVVGGILPEGATLLAGKPKSKKSWFALGLGKAIAMGGKALGSLDVSQGRVLYLDLESSQRRVRSRLNSMAQAREQWPQNLHFATEWPRGEEGLHKMELWMAAYPDTACMVVDVVEDFRPERDPKANPYSEDRAHIKPINQFAEHYHISVLLLHHTRKAKSEDVFDEISGTTGMVSAVANMLILGRSPENNLESILSLRGRDLINDDPLALKWDTYLCQHIIEGSAAEYAISSERRAILAIMDDNTEYSLKDIASGVEKTVKSVGNLMNHLQDARLVEKTGYGKYMKVQRNSHGTSGSGGTSGTHGTSGSYRDVSGYDEPTSMATAQVPPLPFWGGGTSDGSVMPESGPKNELPSVPWVSKTEMKMELDWGHLRQAFARGDVAAIRMHVTMRRGDPEAVLDQLFAEQQPQPSTQDSGDLNDIST